MCGICGLVRDDPAHPIDIDVIQSMNEAMRHRGPDDEGTHVGRGVALAARRLAIIDPVRSSQPLSNEDGTVWAVLNGEIYNFQELRNRLIARGHQFATDGDGETIVHLYEEEGVECVKSLEGMFAFGLYDSRSRQLMLARDRVGKKPLFYSHRSDSLSFASELRALLKDPEIPRDLDYQALDCYLAYQYVPAPFSAFKAVRKLPPASTLVYTPGHVSISRYWRLDSRRKRAVGDPREVHEEIRATIKRAVRRRMVADVPLGAMLSGGIDSAVVVGSMAELSPQPVKTFSVGFENPAFNELRYARMIAEQFGTEHHELVVKPDAVALIPKVVAHYGEPYADSSALATFYLAELASRHVTVALNGDGGDENFAGYTRYAANSVLSRLEVLPLALRRAVTAMAQRMPARRNVRSTYNRARRIGRTLGLEPPIRYARYISYFDPLERQELYTDEFRHMIEEPVTADVIEASWDSASGKHLLDVMLETDIETYLPGDLLVKMDIATMAHSLEARSPLLDREVMELAASLPADLKMRGTEKKAILRDSLRGWIPDEILDRPKMGFEIPIVDWFRNELADYAREVLLDPAAIARGFFRESHVAGLLERHRAGREDAANRIWALLMLEHWLRQFVDTPSDAPAAYATL
jgi:asparagine synthase (glutamine-hydrolysing)